MSRRRRRNRPRRGPRGSSVRVTTTRNGKTAGYRTGGVSIAGVGPTGRVAKGPNLTIRATVRDHGGGLSRDGIRLYLDGSEQRRFYYGRTTGNLSYHPTGLLSSGAHTVEVVAKTGQGRSTATKSWTFTVS